MTTWTRMKEEDKEAAAERMPEIPQGNPQNPQQKAMLDDLARWERKALNKGPDCEFESDCIPDSVRADIVAALALATTPSEIKAAFRGKAVRFIPEGAEEPLPPVPGEVGFSDAEIEQALALWDEIMPQYRGMLDAEGQGDGEQY